MKAYRYILVAFMAVISLYSCRKIEPPVVINPDQPVMSSIISASCRADMVNSSMPYLATRSLIDQVTTQAMQANFIRIDEDVVGGLGSNQNDGLYTFTGHNGGTVEVPYERVNWERAHLLEASVISSPDNTAGIHYRSITFDPIQSYNIIAVANPSTGKDDTTHFYHTRMVGWYPQNCVLPRNEKGKAVYTLFDDERFNDVRYDSIPVPGHGTRVLIKFSDLDGSKDVMVSNVREAQNYHTPHPASGTHPSDISPIDGSNIYRSPFGHYTSGPFYSNYFTYKHYLSAVRVWAYADQSPQNLDMWGKINNVVFQKQPHSCYIWLPEELDTEFGEIYRWEDYANTDIVVTPMFGDDVNHTGENYSASYPITLNGAGSASTKIYLGYALVEPNKPLELELHTTNGVYVVDVASTYERNNGTTDEIFDAGYVYDVMLNLKTDGTIAVLLENESNDHYFDLTTLDELKVGGQTINAYKYANCYIVCPNDDAYKRTDTITGNKVFYDGFCFSATTIGNGQTGILSYGSQSMYPSSATIDPSYAQLVWESSLGLVSEVELLYGYVRFKVPDPTKAGNAVIAVYDSNHKVLWSWHVWITDEVPSDQTFTYGGNSITFLDRNLGAEKAQWTGAGDALKTYGLYYQWGRKDPSMGPQSYNYSQINLMCAPYYDYSSEPHTSAEVKQFASPSMRDGVENPMYLILPSGKTQDYEFNWLYTNNNVLWGCTTQSGEISVVKTIYDPCPFGYRVPASELNTLFSNSTRNTIDVDYGQIRSDGTTNFYFPYTGFKGVDRGLNSIVGAWKYVGQKGDYQSSLYSDVSGTSYMHRSRVYISKSDNWSESGVGSYSSNVTMDYTNRRTAAPVRCVKNENYGVVTSNISLSTTNMVYGSTLEISTIGQSSESMISNVKLERKYTTKAGTKMTEVLFNRNNIGSSSWDDLYAYTVPDETEFANLEDSFTFVFTITNEAGVTSEATTSAKRLAFYAEFPDWISVERPIVPGGDEEPVIGQPVTLSVLLKCSEKFNTVTIFGKPTTCLSSTLTPNAQGLYEATFQSTFAFDEAGNISVPIEVTLDGEGFASASRIVPVWGIEKGDAVSTYSFPEDYYVIQSDYSTSYAATYVALNAAGTSLGAQPNLDYAALFEINHTTSGSNETFTALNVKKNQYVNGTATGNFTLSGTPYSYYFRTSVIYGDFPTRIRPTSSSNIHWRQSSTTAVSLSRTTSYYWNFYPISFIDPDSL